MMGNRFKLLLISSLMLFVFAGHGAPGAKRISNPGNLTVEGLWGYYIPNTQKLRAVLKLKLNSDHQLEANIVKVNYFPGEEQIATCVECQDENKNKPLVGLKVLWGMDGFAHQWSGGEFLEVNTGKILNADLVMSEDHQLITLRVYYYLRFFGQDVKWVRI